MRKSVALVVLVCICGITYAAGGFPKPYAAPCTERENVFAFAEKPAIRLVEKDRYEIAFAVKGYCDVTVGLVDADGRTVRHIASGVLGKNAPAPFQKDSKAQKICWNGKDDLGYYVKEPEKLTVKVSLGLKPTFDKLLGCTSPHNLPGFAWGIAADPQGVYVFTRGINRGHISCRMFDHDAKYVKTVWPPAGNLPPEKLGGMGYVEYEKGTRAVQAPHINMGLYRGSLWMPGGIGGSEGQQACRPAVLDGKIYLLDSGHGPGSKKDHFVHMLHYLNTDGTTEYEGMKGTFWEISRTRTSMPQLAVSPKEKALYMVGWGGRYIEPVLMRRKVDGKKADFVMGKLGKPGSDNKSLNAPTDVACDAEGRVYVVDSVNNRVQIFDPDGGYLTTLRLERPRLIQVHQKTGAVYIAQVTRVKGESRGRLTRYSAFPDLKEETHWDTGEIEMLTLDSWTPKPRLWIGTERINLVMARFKTESGLRLYEDDGKKLKKLLDFDEVAAKSAGENYAGRWDGGCMNHVVCDPVREKVIYKFRATFDLKTGKYEGWMMGNNPKKEELATALMICDAGGHWGRKVRRGGEISEFTFDKRGYMHSNMGSISQGTPPGAPITRMNPDETLSTRYGSHFAEVPYDYGIQWKASGTDKDEEGWTGVIPVPPRNRLGYAWGIGANMRGEVVLNMTSMYVPKMGEEHFQNLHSGMKASGGVSAARKLQNRYAEFHSTIKNVDKQGGKMFFIRRQPGVAIQGATIWTFDSTGEVKHKAGVIAGEWNNGVQLDEDGYVYFTHVRFAMRNGKAFLENAGGNFGGEPLHRLNRMPFNSAYIKTRGHGVKFLSKNSSVPLDALPQRPADLAAQNAEGLPGGPVWVQNAEWIYAGSGPVVAQHCHCPQMRGYLDWYKRSYVPEPYRHSIGILDTNGNLIVHLGRYGNHDSGYGPKSLVPLGGDGIATTMVRFVSGTDNYFCIADWGERLIVTKLTYHAEETTAIKAE